jgi:hypothetical protein
MTNKGTPRVCPEERLLQGAQDQFDQVSDATIEEIFDEVFDEVFDDIGK